MYDIDFYKLIKAQVMENLNGLYLGSHWSNFPLPQINTRKCYDVIFSWGNHFTKNCFSDYSSLEVIEVGFPLDHYFKERRREAVQIRNQYPDSFIISYQDNIMGYDIPYSRNMQINIYRMFINLLSKYPQVVLFLKPKRNHTLEEIIELLPELQEYINLDRVRLFLSVTERRKANPAQVGLASDLVIGLGISSAAAECSFAGCVSFHVDFTGFIYNEFAQKGLNKIVFRDIKTLKKAIEQQIGGNGLSVQECREYHRCLDPFQDEQSYKRTGFIIKCLREALEEGKNRSAAVGYAKEQLVKNTIINAKQEILKV